MAFGPSRASFETRLRSIGCCQAECAPLCAALTRAPVAQLDRVPDYESGGRRFESFLARQERDWPRKGSVPFLVGQREGVNLRTRSEAERGNERSEVPNPSWRAKKGTGPARGRSLFWWVKGRRRTFGLEAKRRGATARLQRLVWNAVLQRVHLIVAKAEMVAGLVYHHMADQRFPADAGLAPFAQ